MVWAVATTSPNTERRALRDLTDVGLSIFLPTIKVKHIRRSKRSYRIFALFPGYLFVLATVALWWSRLHESDDVTGVLMSSDRPAMLPDDVITDLRSRCDKDGVYLEPLQPRFAIGQRVLVKTGPFTDHIGFYQGAIPHEREIALMDMLGALVRVEFEQSALAAAV